ncbi:L-aspartate oxidase [Woodsholea maritima]|uniref:L-aspartate oxidase n=1 Tax=Woodsholea maritima TaxID=240237 RepID=UPI0003637AF0|nr:L-aspartate oxidase [Woodsholea maritima]
MTSPDLSAPDVIIVGAGIAGLWTALNLAPRPVTVLTGSPLGQNASTGWAQGGVAAALGPDDSAQLHKADTIEAGAGLVDAAAADLLARQGPGEVEALAAMGAPLEHHDDGSWALSREAAHSRARVARVMGDGAGAAILAALIKAVKAAPHITVKDGWRACGLIADLNGGCAGVLARQGENPPEPIHAAYTILATGSLCGLYGVTTTPWTSQGQALVWASRLGAVIRDPEFVQFHPTAIDVGRDPAPLATEALRGEGAILVDAAGTRFMDGEHPLGELAPRDIVARAVHRQSQKPGRAYLDTRQAVGEAFPHHFPAVFAACMEAGIDPRLNLIPVAPAAHYHMGGIETDLTGFSGVSGLYAVGECASTGVHGANRLASNSLLEGLVFGAACADALRHAPTRTLTPGEGFIAPALPLDALKALRHAMSADLGVERNGPTLRAMKAHLYETIAEYGPCDALIAALFVCEGALARHESRGGHFRLDYPDLAPEAVHTRLTLTDLALDTRALTPLLKTGVRA